MSEATLREQDKALIEQEEAEEDELHQVIDAVPILDDPELDPLTLALFVNDVAARIKPITQIATRYGFATTQHMRAYLLNNPEIVARIKARKAVWEADDSTDVRVKKLALLNLETAMDTGAELMMDKTVPASERIKAYATFGDIGGVKGNRNNEQANAVGGSGNANKFSVNIIFSRAGKVESFATVEKPPELEVAPIQDDAA